MQNFQNSTFESRILDPESSINTKSTHLTRKLSYKDQRRRYRHEKQKAADELLHTLRDTSVIVRSGWLKVRSALKSWLKLWAVLKPGMLQLFRTEKTKNSNLVGTLLLPGCELIERPSKKTGFCFKLFHPLDQPIWSNKGLDGENHTGGVVLQSLPSTYVIFRVASEGVGKCWMDALELCISCSSLVKRSFISQPSTPEHSKLEEEEEEAAGQSNNPCPDDLLKAVTTANMQMLDAHGAVDDDDVLDDEEEEGDVEDEESSCESFDEAASSIKSKVSYDTKSVAQTSYVCETESIHVDFLSKIQSEELAEENRSLLWFLLKQIRPGMDLSRVVLPTFILESRSFLDKFTDYFYHADLISRLVSIDDPYERMCSVVAWYFSGFYKKPKGLKKPYNPILGECFRCSWLHPSGSRTYFIAEQVSHHPPISAFYVSNRKDGFTISASILAKSKFYGNSISALLEGKLYLTLLTRGEVYSMSIPYAHVKGIMLGSLTVEMGGKVTIFCESTGYSADIDFRLKPLWSSNEEYNRISGKVRLGTETLAHIHGKWDGPITIKHKTRQNVETLWNPSQSIIAQRLPRYIVPLNSQTEWESARLWNKVSTEIASENQEGATREKHILEENQRQEAKRRLSQNIEYVPKLFTKDPLSGDYIYNYVDSRPWNPHNDISQYENDFQVRTTTKLNVNLLSNTTIDKLCRDVTPSKTLSAACKSGAECHNSCSNSSCNRQLYTQSSMRVQRWLRKIDTRHTELSEEVEALRNQLRSMETRILSAIAGRALVSRDRFGMFNSALILAFFSIGLHFLVKWFTIYF